MSERRKTRRYDLVLNATVNSSVGVYVRAVVKAVRTEEWVERGRRVVTEPCLI